jgi:hypothetical protein
VLLAVHGGDGRLGFVVRPHLNESEPFAAPGLAVADDFSAFDGSVRREHLLQRRAIDAVAEISNVQLAAHDQLLN